MLAERHTLALDLRGIVVDAIAASGPTAPRSQLLNLFQGGFLEDLAGLDTGFDAWVEKERQRLASLARWAGEAFLREGHGKAETIAAARALLRIDQSHHAARRGLIQALIELNDLGAGGGPGLRQWREAMGLAPDQPPPAEIAGWR